MGDVAAMSKKWFVVHAYSGFEKSVQRALTERIARSDIADQFDICFLMELRHAQRREIGNRHYVHRKCVRREERQFDVMEHIDSLKRPIWLVVPCRMIIGAIFLKAPPRSEKESPIEIPPRTRCLSQRTPEESGH